MVRSVNSVAPGRKGPGTRGNDGLLKYVLLVIQERERSKTIADAFLSFTFSVDRTGGGEDGEEISRKTVDNDESIKDEDGYKYQGVWGSQELKWVGGQ